MTQGFSRHLAMNGSTPKEELISFRSLALIGVLLTLCYSECVGIQLLLTPSEPDRYAPAETSSSIASGTCSMPTPLRNEPAPSRGKVATQRPERTLAQQHILILISAIPAILSKFQNRSLEKICLEQTTPVHSHISACHLVDRGPPAPA